MEFKNNPENFLPFFKVNTSDLFKTIIAITRILHLK